MSAVSDFGDADGAEVLAMSAELFVLLLALVMEDQNFLGAAVFQYLSGNQRALAAGANLAIAALHCEHVVELNGAVGLRLGLDPNHIAGSDPVLLSTRANNSVHASSVQ